MLMYFPVAQQVFTLDDQTSLYSFYSTKTNEKKDQLMENIAEQIATLCDTLKEYPAIRYRKYKGFELSFFLYLHIQSYACLICKGTRGKC